MLNISIVPLPYKILIGVVAMAAVFGAGAWQGSSSENQKWQLKDTQRIAAQQAAQLQANELTRKREQQLIEKTLAIDTKYQEELNNAQTEINILRRAVRDGSVRLSVKSAKPSSLGAYDSSAASGIDADARCELDQATADDLISITADGDTAIQQLTALQGYVNSIFEK